MRLFSFFYIFLFSSFLFSQDLNFSEREKEWIKENPIVYFGYDNNWPPYEMYREGKYIGICNDFIQIISKKTGIKFIPLKNMTWKKSYQKLKDNSITMVPGAGITPERKEFLVFTERYITLPWVIATKKGNKEVKDLSSLNFKRVSIPRDYLQEEILRRDYPNIKLILRNDFAECLQDVSSGYSEATTGSLGVISYMINEFAYTNLSITAFTEYKDYGVSFAFPKNKVILRDIMDKALKQISFKERGKINSRWINVNFKAEKPDYSQVWNSILIIFFIIFGATVVYYIWNRSLRKQISMRKKIEIELSETFEEINKQNNDKTILLQEIHHRVKNNLQIIISLLRLQSNSHTNKDVQDALNEAIDRINSISLVHDHIYKNPNLAELNLEKYIFNLGDELKRVFVRDKEIILNINTNNLQLPIKPIIPMALILNELFTNSLKYAFRNKTKGEISISLIIEDDCLNLVYQDNGEWFNNSYTRNFGTYIIEIFTEQLNGSFQKETEPTTKYSFKFLDYKE